MESPYIAPTEQGCAAVYNWRMANKVSDCALVSPGGPERIEFAAQDNGTVLVRVFCMHAFMFLCVSACAVFIICFIYFVFIPLGQVCCQGKRAQLLLLERCRW